MVCSRFERSRTGHPRTTRSARFRYPTSSSLPLGRGCWRRRAAFIFPTKQGKPNGHMLRALKSLAKKAGLHGEFKLHKFRKTYATLQHRDGIDARTIQEAARPL